MNLDYLLVILLFIALFYLAGITSAKTHQSSVKQETINWIITYVIFFSLLIAFLGFVFLPSTVIHTLFFDSCTIGYNKPPDMSIPLHANVLGILAGIGVAWFLASKSDHMGTINEMGTKLVGNDESPNGYISTKWLVVLFLPLIPIRSYEVLGEHQGASERIYYSMRPTPELARIQVLATYRKYSVWYIVSIISAVGISLLGTWKCF
jgi:hypothetical protein